MRCTDTPPGSGGVPGAGAVKTSTWWPRAACSVAKRKAVLPAPPGYGGKVAVRCAIRYRALGAGADEPAST